MKLKRFAVLSILILLLLAGCGAQPKESYTVQFLYDDTVTEQVLEEGSVPEFFAPADRDGMRFICWEPEISAVTADAQYTAVFAPALNQHVPFLFPDKEGCLNPDAPFTYIDMNRAITTLADPNARKHFSVRLGGVKPVTFGQLQETLTLFFPDTAAEAFSGYDAEQEVSRGEAAVLLTALLGRTGESISLPRGTMGLVDVSPKREDYCALMEASIQHAHGKQHWDQVALPTGHAPGMELTKGRLRCFDEDGYLLRDTIVENSLTINSDGYYTCGNEELDQLVTERLALLQEQNPEMDRLELLRPAFDYSRDYFMYLRKPAYETGHTGWEIQDAITMLTTGHGNCYNYAAVFWALARGLGFDAQANCGRIGAYPHGWVTLILDDTKYYFDPELEMSHRAEYKFDWNLFMMPEHTAMLWDYHDAEMEAADAKLREEAAAAQAEIERIRQEVVAAQQHALDAQNHSYQAQNELHQAETTVLWTKGEADRTQNAAEQMKAEADRLQQQADTAQANAAAARKKADEAKAKADAAKKQADDALAAFQSASEKAAAARANGTAQEEINALQAAAGQAQQDYYALQGQALQLAQEAVWADNAATQAEQIAAQTKLDSERITQQAEAAVKEAEAARQKAQQAVKDAEQAKAAAEKAIADAALAREEAIEKQTAAAQPADTGSALS